MDPTNLHHDLMVLNSLNQNSDNGLTVEAGNLHWNVVGDHSFTDEGYFVPNSEGNSTANLDQEQCTYINCPPKQKHKVDLMTDEASETNGIICMSNTVYLLYHYTKFYF